MIEGMAVAASQMVYPNFTDETYLHFSEDQLEDQEHFLRSNAANFLELMLSDAGREVYEPWFAGNSPTAPARGGYLLGREVIRRLETMYTYEEMVRMNPAELREHAEEQLSDIAGARVFLVQ